MLKKIAALAALAAAPILMPAAAQAQTAAQNSVLVIYGDDKCPTNSNGDEIVVCQRLHESERFRLPKSLRDQGIKPQAESWATRSQDALTTGATGTGSCSAVGAGGATGCHGKQLGAWKRQERARKKAEQDLPLP